jgi:hypothetical protein
VASAVNPAQSSKDPPDTVPLVMVRSRYAASPVPPVAAYMRTSEDRVPLLVTWMHPASLAPGAMPVRLNMAVPLSLSLSTTDPAA